MSHIQTQTEWEEEMSAKILNFVRRELYLEFRYMEMALSAFSYKKIDGLLTFATDGRKKYAFFGQDISACGISLYL